MSQWFEDFADDGIAGTPKFCTVGSYNGYSIYGKGIQTDIFSELNVKN